MIPTNRYDQQLKDPKLRNKLPHRRHFYLHTFSRGRALGYFRPKGDGPGVWHAQVLRAPHRHKRCNFAFADDLNSANGRDILTFEDALEEAKKWCSHPAQASYYNEPSERKRVYELNVCPCGPVYTVGHALAEYVNWKRTFAASRTFVSLLADYNYYVYPKIGTLPAEQLTSDHIRELMEHVIATPTPAYLRLHGPNFDPSKMDAETRRRRRRTANKVLSYVKGALNHAWEDEKISDDRAWRRVPQFKGAKRTRIDFLTRSECRALIMASESATRSVVLGLLYTGCRISELLDLRVEDVSRTRMAVFIKSAKHYSSRNIALPEEGYLFIKRLCFGRDRNERIFLRQDRVPWTKHHLDRGLKRALARAGLSTKFVYHTLRHTYASLRLQEGLSPVAVARQLGHKDIRTVLEIYSHCTDDFIDEEIRKRFVPILEGDNELTGIVERQADPVLARREEFAEFQAASALLNTR